MSVTFSIQANPTGKYDFRCVEENRTYGGFTLRMTTLVRDAHTQDCVDCAAYSEFLIRPAYDVTDAYDVNMSNTNTAAVAREMGIDEVSGSMSSHEFLNRALIALALPRGSDAIPATASRLGNGPMVYDYGRAEGYVDERLSQLADLAIVAARLGRDITWA